MEKATFAAGCFWGVEEVFRQTPGVKSTSVGYTGGSLPNATYHDVCSGNTGHAEAVQVEFDPSEVSYEELLQIFWHKHNPTTRNRQGWDIGTQYRSAIFYYTPEQQAAAISSKEQLAKSGAYGGKEIVTEIVPAVDYYAAEEYHQQYLAKRGQASCHI